MSDGSFQYFKCCVVHSWNLCSAAWIFSASHMSAIPSVIPDPNMNKHLAWLHKCQHRLIEATRLLNPDICTHLYLCVCVCEGGFLHDCTDPGLFVCLIPWMCMYMGVMFMHIRIHMCIWLFVCVWTHAHLPVLVCVCVCECYLRACFSLSPPSPLPPAAAAAAVLLLRQWRALRSPGPSRLHPPFIRFLAPASFLALLLPVLFFLIVSF